jgi:hypothetical protein
MSSPEGYPGLAHRRVEVVAPHIWTGARNHYCPALGSGPPAAQTMTALRTTALEPTMALQRTMALQQIMALQQGHGAAEPRRSRATAQQARRRRRAAKVWRSDSEGAAGQGADH